MATRMYLVELKKKSVLVEAISVEAAIKIATAPQVKSCTIPSPLEVARLMRDNVETIAPSLAPAQQPAPAEAESGEGVGRLGLAEGGDANIGDGVVGVGGTVETGQAAAIKAQP